jgi:hypothetical protein
MWPRLNREKHMHLFTSESEGNLSLQSTGTATITITLRLPIPWYFEHGFTLYRAHDSLRAKKFKAAKLCMSQPEGCVSG